MRQWIEVLADGTVIEWNGIAPDIVVPFDSASVSAKRDPVLAWAFRQAGILPPWAPGAARRSHRPQY